MSITDELREYTEKQIKWLDMSKVHYRKLFSIADRIDAEHEEVVQREHETAYDAGYQNGENAILAVLDKRGNSDVDKTMAEHGWYRALDADKKPIRLGDEVYQVEGGWVYTVKSITFYPDNTTISFECKHGFGCDNAHNVRHYHAPTVEEVLREMHAELDEVTALYVGEAIDSDERDHDEARIFAEYAKRLTLAESEDA